jgi:MFS family permease
MWHYRHSVLLLTTLAFATTMIARLAVSPLLPDITTAFSVSTGDVGMALTGMWSAYALSQYPGGVLANAIGEKRVILLAVGLIACSSVLLALAPAFPLFAAATILLGAAAGLPYSATTSLLSKNFDNIGRAIGFYIGGGPVAGLVVPIVATALSARFGWRAATLFTAVVAAPVFLSVTWGIRPPPVAERESVDSALSLRSMRELLARPGIRYTILLAVGGSFAWQATASFLPTFLVKHRAMTIQSAGVLFSAYFVVHGLTQPMTGWLSDRLGRDRASVITMGSAMIGYCVLLLASGPLGVVGGVALVGLGMSWGAPVQSRFMDQLDGAERTVGFGLVRTVYMTIGSLGSVVVGTLSDVYGWTVAFAVLALIMAVEVVLLTANVVLDLEY